MAYLYGLSISIAIIYLLIAYIFFGFTTSISDTVYGWKKLDYSLASIFTIFCWGTALPLLIYWIEYSKSDWDFVPFIAASALMFVGASPLFKDDGLERKVHSVAAVICLVASYVWSVLFGNAYLGVIFMLMSVVINFMLKKNRVYWIEIIAFVNIYIQLQL